MMRLADGRVDLWRVSLASCTDDDAELLSRDERVRAARFRFDADRERWVRARAVLRRLLGRYLEVDGRRIRLEVSPNGKPAVPGGAVSFNLSHAGDEALYGFTGGCAVGVDVEVFGRRVDVLALAERALDRDEVSRLQLLRGSAREQEFLRSWVRHEAALKCRGGRLGDRVVFRGLSVIDVGVGPAAAGAAAVAGGVHDVRVLSFGAPGRPLACSTTP
jgi:4'-phosphopantetheinyl transferase